MQPIIYPKERHHIDLSHIDRDAIEAILRLQDAGHAAYLVGGGVRDLLMGLKPKDFDISTSARPEQVKRLFSNCLLIGRRFRLAHLRYGKKILEVSTFRAGDNGDELIVTDNTWGSEEEDVLRRDFTINGLFFDPRTETVIDYVGGVKDLTEHRLCSIGDPLQRFKQDPVRMVRLLKFRARFGFAIDPLCWSALLALKDEILKSSPARILEELLRMLESGYSGPFFSLLDSIGMLHPLLSPAARVQYLPIIDHFHRTKAHPIDRGVLIALLALPLIEEQLKTPTFEDLNFTDCFDGCRVILEPLFNKSFVTFTRRQRFAAEFALAMQQRFDQSMKTTRVKGRLLKHPDIPLAMQLLYIRSCVHPKLRPVFETWRKGESA